MRQRTLRSCGLVLALALASLAAGAQQGDTGGQGAGGGTLGLMGGLAGIEELLGPGFSVEKILAAVGYFVPPPAGQASAPQRAGNIVAARTTTSDSRNYLSARQIDTLLPLMRELEQNPFPSPSKARGIQKALDDTLSKAQQQDWESYLASVQKQLERLQSQAAGRQPLADFANLSAEERQKLMDSLPEEQRQQIQQRLQQLESQRAQAEGAQAGGAQAGGALASRGAQASPEERRRILVQALIRRMETRRTELGR